MSLDSYKRQITIGNLYKVKRLGGTSGSEQLTPNISAKTGTFDIYSYNGLSQPTDLSDLRVLEGDSNIDGGTFERIPSYIVILESQATLSEVITSGIEVEDLGSIS